MFKEAYRDNKNSTYAICNRVDAEITTEAPGGKRYNLPQREVDRIERMLQGGCDTDVESDNESPSDREESVGLPQHALQYKDGTICDATQAVLVTLIEPYR